MMSKMKLDFRLLSIPTALGCLGLRPWRGLWHVSVWSARLPIPVAVLNQTGFRAVQQKEKYSTLGIPISRGEAFSLADREVREKMATDDMIELAGTIRRVRRAELAGRKIVPSQCSGPPPNVLLRCFSRLILRAAHLTVELESYQKLKQEVFQCRNEVARLYGSERESIETVTAISNLAAVKRKSLGKMLHHAPWFYYKLLQVEGRYKLRRSSAVESRVINSK
ncbi:hypothetical protein MTO96_046556 [Rhipicephalus appendiculatus]